MLPPADNTSFAPCLQLHSSKLLSKVSDSHKASTLPLTRPTMGFAINTTKALAVKSSRMKAFQRKRKEAEDMAPVTQADATAPAPVKPKTKHIDLLEAVSQRERGLPSFVLNHAGTLNQGSGSGLQRSNAGEDQSPGLGSDQSHRQMAYNDYPAHLSTPLVTEPKSDLPDETDFGTLKSLLLPKLPEPSHSTMEVPIHASARERRPKIQLTIPRTHSHTYAVRARDQNEGKPAVRTRATSKPISLPSSTTHEKIIDSGGPPARLSVVSPLSVMEMPKPRRPFSALSLEGTTTERSKKAILPSKSASSESSDDNDDGLSNYSPGSSISSVASHAAAIRFAQEKRPTFPFLAVSPTTGTFDPIKAVSLFPKPPKALRSASSFSYVVDRNKPLPPEPGRETRNVRRKTPATLCVCREPVVDSPHQRISRVSSLRSKYTPADLDALDDAFKRSSPPKLQPFPIRHRSPTLSQAELALEAHLGTIAEVASLESQDVPLMHDPLQISRGPMHMEPSRRPPPTPNSQAQCDGSPASRRKLQKRSSTHVALQMRATKVKHQVPGKGIAAPLVISNSKAHRVLGTNQVATPMERESSTESHWDSSDSAQPYSSSPNMSIHDSDTSISDFSPIIPDAAFEEVRQRLELLSPKSDASKLFEFHHQNLPDTLPSPPNPPTVMGSNNPAACVLTSQPTINDAHLQNHELLLQSLSGAKAVTELQGPPLEVTPAPQNKVVPTFECRVQQDGLSSRSLGSIAVSKIPEIYAGLSPSKSTMYRSMSEDEVERMISAEVAEKVLLRILQNLDNLEDLFHTATVSRGFYRTFKRHELSLMKNALFGMSPAAWELREMTPLHLGPSLLGGTTQIPSYTPTLYLQHYTKDMYIIVALKSRILIHCESFLRADTVIALKGGETQRASQIDDAFWRVWTFCRIFGCGTNREDDIVGQMDWLNGGILAKQQRRNTNTVNMGMDVDMNSIINYAPAAFGQGNDGGLGAEELYDMIEIWTCLGVLVRGFQGRRTEAREFGIFGNLDITPGDVEKEDAAIEEWTYYLLTLAPPTILDIAPPRTPTPTVFDYARSRGYTTWTLPSLGASRSTFLKQAVSRVYHDKTLQRHDQASFDSQRPSSSSSSIPPPNILAARERIAAHRAEIRAKRSEPGFKALLPSEDRPMSNFPYVLSKLETSPFAISGRDPINNTPLSGVTSVTSTSLQIPASISPVPSSNAITSDQLCCAERQDSSTTVPLGPQVRDPVDIAVERLVDMGFEEKKAKKALADTDSGNSIEFDKALELLVREKKRDVNTWLNWSCSGTMANEATGTGNRSCGSPVQPPLVGLGIEGVARYA